MREGKFTKQLQYRFDNMMARGMGALIGWLLLVTIGIVVLIALIAVLTGSQPTYDDGQAHGFFNVLWMTLLHTIDEGALVEDDPGNPLFVLLMFLVTVFGIFIFSGLIGILSNLLEAKMADLRKGRSVVLEENHTVILGWSPMIFGIISELVIANENQPDSCIAILAEKDKVEMEDAIRNRVGQTGRTRIVCRTGNPIDMTDLAIINPTSARSIIILSSEAHDPDAHVLKNILALTHQSHMESDQPLPYYIVAGIQDIHNLEVIQTLARREVVLLPVSDLISRIAVQTCRQSGLSVVYIELLDFSGGEIYFQEEPRLVGTPFGDTLLAYKTSAVIGVHQHTGQVLLNPPMDYTIQPGDKIIAISEDDDTVILNGVTDHEIQTDLIMPMTHTQPAPERTLILGWNERGATIVEQLDLYVAPGSETTIVAEIENVEAIISAQCGPLKNQTVTFKFGSITNRRLLDSLEVHTYDHIITLSYLNILDVQEADARTMITLLHLRDIGEKMGRTFSIVSEILDLRNRELAEVTRADDFIVSDKLISLMLSQLAENRELMDVLTELFNPQGSELYLRPAGDFVKLNTPVNFYTVVAAARQHNMIAIGYRLQAEANNVDALYGVYVNPNKAETIRFCDDDKVIVLAEE